MKKILVPIDFSGDPSDLINYAVSFGQHFKYKLLFLHSLISLIPTTSTQSSFEEEMLEDIESKETLLIKKLASSCEQLGVSPADLNSEYEVKFGGNVIDDILEFVNSEEIDFIIMSTHGTSGLKKFFLGSTTSSIISQAHVPVLVIPPNYKFRPIEQIICASDLQDLENEINQTLLIAKKMETDIEVVNFAYDNSVIDESTNKMLQSHAIDFKKVNRNIELTLIDQIRAYMKSKKNSILCMFTTPTTKLRKLFLGSSTSAIVEHLKFPLLSLPKYKYEIKLRKKR